jgi:hypothetical protein
LFTCIPLIACRRYEPRKHPRMLANDASWDSAFPFVGQGRLLQPRSISGLFSRSLYSGLQPPCLRFAVDVTGRHARLGTRLLAKLCRGRHSRRLGYMRFQGATLTDPDVQNSRIRFFTGEFRSWWCNHHTIRDPSVKQGSCQRSYPLSFRGQVCEAQGLLPCFPPTALVPWRLPSLSRVPEGPVPRMWWVL